MKDVVLCTKVFHVPVFSEVFKSVNAALVLLKHLTSNWLILLSF
jgi:hypothetical protein